MLATGSSRCVYITARRLSGLIRSTLHGLCWLPLHSPLCCTERQRGRGKERAVILPSDNINGLCVCVCSACVCVCGVCGSLVKQGLVALSVYRRWCSGINTDWNREIIVLNKMGEKSLTPSHTNTHTLSRSHTHTHTVFVIWYSWDSFVFICVAVSRRSHLSRSPGTD